MPKIWVAVHTGDPVFDAARLRLGQGNADAGCTVVPSPREIDGGGMILHVAAIAVDERGHDRQR